LSFWTVGAGEAATRRFGPDLYRLLDGEKTAVDRILLAISDHPLGRARLSQRTRISGDSICELLRQLEAVHLVERYNDRWSTSVPVIDDEQMGRIRRVLVPVAREVAVEIGRHLPRLRAVYDSARSASDPTWDAVAHLMLDKFVVDGTFHSAIGRLERERGARQYYSDGQSIIPAFFLERGENYSTFGSNWYPFVEGDRQREVYVLHGSAFLRFDIRMNEYRGDSSFSDALFALAPDGGTASLRGSQEDVFRSLGWIEGDSLLVPAVRAGTVRLMWPALEEVGSAAAEVVFDHYSLILDGYRRSPYAEFLDAGGDYLQVCYHVLFGVVLEQLAEAGVVPEFPDQVPEHFGVYLVIGQLF
jgi:hypothetical protein